jgi:predicted NBD/HSP70 family sugar kinase
MRAINAAAVLGVLRGADQLSVSELADGTGLSRQAVTRALGGLEGSGLVTFRAPETTVARSGRPAQFVEFNAGAGYLIGVSVHPASIRVAIADLRGAFVTRREFPLPAEADVVATTRDAVGSTLGDAGIETSQVWAACIGVPGIVDADTGNVKLSSSMSSIQGTGLVETLSDYLECEAYVDNDVKLATEGEQWRGAPHVLSSLVLIEWGERVGAGLLLNGGLYRGASNDSGDLGFLDLAVEGGASADDGLGPFERTVGGAELVRLVQQHGDGSVASLEQAIDAILEERPAALTALQEVAVRFARGVAVIRALLDPQLVIVGGPMARIGDRLIEELTAALAGQVLNQPPLELSTLGGDAVVHGAVHHALAIVDTRRLAPGALSESMSTTAR